MFSGIVEEVGRVLHVAQVDSKDAARGSDQRVTIAASTVLEGTKFGDSISVSGCCLTVVKLNEGSFEVELSSETLAKTAPRWSEGSQVNLERALRVADRLGGHIVSGHVDGVGTVLELDAQPGAYVLRVRAPSAIAGHLVPKGSITVDGVSLTLVDVGGPGGTAEWPATDFSLWLIPHTLDVTTLGELTVGAAVNLESDVLAKYVERQQLLGAAGTQWAAAHRNTEPLNTEPLTTAQMPNGASEGAKP